MKNKEQPIDRAESSMMWVLAIAIIVKILIFSTSCKTLEQKCTERFPSEVTEVVRVETSTDSLYITEKEFEYIDTTECLPTRDAYYVFDTIKIKVPGETVYYEYTCIDTVIVLRDQPKVNYLTATLQAAQEDLKSEKKKSKRRVWGFIAVCVVSFLLFVLLLMSAAKR